MSAEFNELKALYIPYDRVHFLFNHTQCISSLYASDILTLKSKHRYLYQFISLGADRLLFFDLNGFFQNSFKASSPAGAELAVVCEVASFRLITRNFLQSAVFDRLRDCGLADDRIAFRIPSNTVMRSIPIQALVYQNTTIGRFLETKGVLALHPTETSMGFFIDLDRLILSKLLFARASKSEGEDL